MDVIITSRDVYDPMQCIRLANLHKQKNFWNEVIPSSQNMEWALDTININWRNKFNNVEGKAKIETRGRKVGIFFLFEKTIM